MSHPFWPLIFGDEGGERQVALRLFGDIETQLGHCHLSAQTHHLAEHLLRVVSHQALLDVTDVRKKVADGCDPSSAGGGDVVVAALVAELDAMLAQVRHAA